LTIAVTRRDKDIVEVGSLHTLDRAQRIVADRRIAGRRSRREVDSHGSGREIDGVVGCNVETAPTVNEIIAGCAVKGFGTGGAVASAQRIVEHRCVNRIDTTEGVMSGRCVAVRGTGTRRDAGLQVHNDPPGRVGKSNPRIAIAGDGVVAPHAVEFVEGAVGAGISAGAGESDGVESIGGVRTSDRFDGQKRIRTHRESITCHSSHGQLDVDTPHRRRVERVVRAVEAAPAVDRVVTGAAFEYLDCAGSIAGAEQLVVKSRADDARKPRPDEVVGPDRRIAGCRVRVEVDRNGRCRVGIGNARPQCALAVDGTGDGVVAAPALELVITCKSGRIKSIRLIAADDAFDIDQRVASDTRAGYSAGCKIDGNAARGQFRIDRAVKALPAVERIVAGQALQPVVAP
jgi:hypothetical protein